jgi:beta-glucanase (GH16 family)
MKNKIIYTIITLLSLFTLTNCQKDEASFGEITSPTDLQITGEIVGKTTAAPYGDGSGKVNFVATASNAISYKYIFSNETKNVPSGEFQYRFTQNGVNVHTVTVVAYGKGGVSTSKTITVEVLSNYTDDEAVNFLTGGTNKKWYWAASELGHLGVGPNNDNIDQNYFGYYYLAQPWEKAASAESSCLYENIMTFTKDGNQLKYELNNNGHTFFNGSYQNVPNPPGTAGYDYCYNYSTTGVKNVTLAPSESVVSQNPNHLTQTRGTLLNFSDNGFMGYYVGNSTYEILSITENRMKVRVIQANNTALAWYHTFTTIPPVQDPIADYTNLIWSDEFNTDGAPDATKWGYDLGNNNGWGNNEVQNYTNSSANAIVTGGNLKITAIKSGSTYTSARLKTQGKFDFKYGKVEVRAKLPTGGGTWPAIWMLGANISSVTWPNCGEIDIMEHKGNNPNVIYGSLHYPGNFGGNANTNNATFPGVSTSFKVYKVLWTPSSIKFYVDGVLFHTFINNGSVPFNNNFFLLLNVAMGGTFGGAIDPAFLQSTMEVDYVRVYQ